MGKKKKKKKLVKGPVSKTLILLESDIGIWTSLTSFCRFVLRNHDLMKGQGTGKICSL